MPIIGNGNNALHELARAMAAGGRRSAATALRKLAYEGYSSLEQVDQVPDWILLSIRGIGIGRLVELRRLSRPDWQPPSPQALQAGVWFLSAVRFALHYWPPETLATLIQSSVLPDANGGSLERRLALDVFSQAAHRAQRYCTPGELIQALWQADNGHCSSYIPRELGVQGEGTEPQPTPVSDTAVEFAQDNPTAESDRYAYSARRRREIVEKYRVARDNGLVENKDAWAQSNHNITGRTLLNYEREFPETEQSSR